MCVCVCVCVSVFPVILIINSNCFLHSISHCSFKKEKNCVL